MIYFLLVDLLRGAELIRQQEIAMSVAKISWSFLVFFKKHPIIWQYGERRPVWTVEVLNSPYSVSWHRLSSEGENGSWKNQTGCMVVSGEDCCIFLGIACSLQSGEITRLVSGQGITILPSLRTALLPF